MRVTICAIGRSKNDPAQHLLDDFEDRIKKAGPSTGLKSLTMIEVEAPRGLSGPERQSAETKALLAKAPSPRTGIVLDGRGAALTSEAFSEKIRAWRDASADDLVFFIGGADGHSDEIFADARLTLSLGSATWPHMLARVMVLEQLYRAVTILSGHPYHRG
ncbi:MAG: 23S rRNA (pseudouridine(1915)-N(3))-methyltransferase RlmH [Pseudomonadota bacterium]